MLRLSILLAALLMMASCATPIPVNDLIGTWDGKLGDSTQIILGLAEDGTAQLTTTGPDGETYRTGAWRRESNQIMAQFLQSNGRAVNDRITYFMEDEKLVARGWTLRNRYQAFAEPLRMVRRAPAPADASKTPVTQTIE